MDPNGVVRYTNNNSHGNSYNNHTHRRSPSSDRFLGVFSPPSSSGVISGGSSLAGDDFNEDDVFWTGDFAEKKLRSPDSVKPSHRNPSNQFGILAALPENQGRKPNLPVVNRNPRVGSPVKPRLSPSSSRLIPLIPRPNKVDRLDRDVSQSVPVRFQQSAPVNVPVFNRNVRSGGELADVDIIEDDDEEEMLPPHEIVARGSSPRTAYSVLEGAGRTLKGRDLRLVRNAVWRKTGFLD